MATIVLSAAGGAALGGASVGGGGVLGGLSSVVIGRAVGGATLGGRVIDQSILGAGSDPIETGRVDRFRLMGASEGASVPQVYGRTRVAGQVIWATKFHEHQQRSGGKGMSPPSPKTVEYSYTVNLAVALCEGEITRIGRIWADGGAEVAASDLNIRVYTGSQDQLPDPKIEAVQGAGQAPPAYRGIAYVMFEDLDVTRFGNRIPQLNFEVIRPPELPAQEGEVARGTQAVAIMPGRGGEYALATSQVTRSTAPGGVSRVANANSPSGKTDFETSLEVLTDELPNCNAASLIVSWFGDDLRADSCTLRPKVEDNGADGQEMPWSVSGETRTSATAVPSDAAGKPIYGGTPPTDQSVKEAITALAETGKSVTFYPFILMDQTEGNTLPPDPWTGATGQPHLPWRGRITLSIAPGQDDTTDQTAAAEAEVAAFFGTAQSGDFTVTANGVSYSGPAEWSYRRMILHYAHLCASAGGAWMPS